MNLFVRPQTSSLWTAAKSNTCEDRANMVLKKVDNRIRVLIENGVQTKHRSLFVVVGDKGRDQVSKTRCVRMFSSLAEFADQTASSTCWNPIAVHFQVMSQAFGERNAMRINCVEERCCLPCVPAQSSVTGIIRFLCGYFQGCHSSPYVVQSICSGPTISALVLQEGTRI